MKKWIIAGVSILGMLSSSAFTNTSYPYYNQDKIGVNDITAIINKDTTEKELEDLKQFFSENGIELVIDNIKFNDQNQITSVSITLKKDGSKSKYTASSAAPISDLELGFKNGNLYITNSGMFDIASWKNQSSVTHPKTIIDSLFNGQNFAFNFNYDEEDEAIFFNGNRIDIGKLKDQIMNSFQFEEDEDGNFNFQGQFPQHFNKSKKFSFINDPDIEKLIIIDGKESNFETLDELANTDQLEAVDFLKANTAISIYGDKARDGAIIAITKKN